MSSNGISSKYESFIFESYLFDEQQKTLNLHYSYDGKLQFTETYTFNFEFADYDPTVLDKALQTLFFIAGVSYYKAYLPATIKVSAGDIDAKAAVFYSKTYQKGLGEFFYVNDLDPKTEVDFPITHEESIEAVEHSGSGFLVGLGGGKDSLVSVELLREQNGFSTWSVGHKDQLEPLVETIDPSNHYWIGREWDKKLLELNDKDALNGHIPISAILAAAGIVTAVLTGKRDVVVSNESSANEPTLLYRDTEINHQYSKSLEFEIIFKSYLNHIFGESIRYYSLLRPYSELRIAELFAQSSFEKYRHVFTSCNRAFTHAQNRATWCGECSKCAFVFLILTPFVTKEKLEQVYGKNLLMDTSLQPMYKQLLGIEGDKPLDCVGQIQESRVAMDMAKKQYPELQIYTYETDPIYDYRQLSEHLIPDDVKAIAGF